MDSEIKSLDNSHIRSCSDVFCGVDDKHITYLYPEQTQETLVQLDYHGELIVDYPEYNEKIGEWRVTAHPDGTLVSHADGSEYSYLF